MILPRSKSSCAPSFQRKTSAEIFMLLTWLMLLLREYRRKHWFWKPRPLSTVSLRKVFSSVWGPVIFTDACHPCLSTVIFLGEEISGLVPCDRDVRKALLQRRSGEGFLRTNQSCVRVLVSRKIWKRSFPIFFENWFQPGILVTQRMESADSIGMQK